MAGVLVLAVIALALFELHRKGYTIRRKGKGDPTKHTGA